MIDITRVLIGLGKGKKKIKRKNIQQIATVPNLFSEHKKFEKLGDETYNK
jgi:hypothetical protein